jgi:hypothetical protein
MYSIRKLVIVLALLAFSCPAFAATWTFKQGNRNSTCTLSTSTCALALTGVTGGVGDVIVVHAAYASGALITISSATLGLNNFTLVPSSGCGIFLASSGTSTDCAYLINPTAAGTAITVNVSTAPTATWFISAEEYSTTGTAAFDAVNTASNATASTSQIAPSVTLAGANDVIVQGIKAVSPTAISGGYLDALSAFTGNISVAYLLNTATGTGPTWTTGSGKSVMNAIAFSDGSTGVVVNPPHVNIF